MVEFTLSSQVSKILSRFDRTLTSSPSYIKSLSFVQDSPASGKSSGQSFNRANLALESPESSTPTSSYQNLQHLYKSTIEKYVKPASPRSLTPEYHSIRSIKQLTEIQEYSSSKGNRSTTPVVSSSLSMKKMPCFQPRLNKNSIKIAEKLGESKERLLANQMSKSRIKEESFTYRPKINALSKKIGKNKEGKRWDLLYVQGKEKKKEMERIRSEVEMKERELEESSFRPNVLAPSLNADPEKTVERLNNWAKSKEIKIKERKETELDRDMKECTFIPKLVQVSYANDGLNSVKGVGKYLQRGKKIKLEKVQEVSPSHSPSKDIDRKKYKELVEALHNELFSLEL